MKRKFIITEQQYKYIVNRLGINEAYLPSNFESMGEKIRLYHGTDYDGLVGIIESGVIDARIGRRHGETKGVNWFTTNGDRLSFSKGYAYSIDVDKSEFENHIFNFMNDTEVTNYSSIDIQNKNFQIVEAFYSKIDHLRNVLENSIKRENGKNNGIWRFFNYCKRNSNRFDWQAGIVTIDDPVMLKVANQLGISEDEWYESICNSTNTIDESKSLTEMAYPVTWNIEEFANIKSYSGRLKYCQERLEKIASGSARVVFKIDDEKCLKVAKNQKGIAQNEEEVRSYAKETGIGAEVFNFADNYEWIEMELARKAKPSDFKRIVGYDFNFVCEFINWTFSHYSISYRRYPHLYNFNKENEDLYAELIEEYGFFHGLYYYMADTTLNSIGDLQRISSYGVVKRDGEDEIVLIDFGLTDDVYNQYYGRR